MRRRVADPTSGQFRAATAAALHASAYPYLASALLQHTDTVVTETHYNRARSLQASLCYQAILDEMLCGRESDAEADALEGNGGVRATKCSA